MPAVPKKERLPFAVALAGVMVVGSIVVIAVLANGSSGGVDGSRTTTLQQQAEDKLLATITTGPSSSWPQEPADFKGLKFGMSLSEAKRAAVLKDRKRVAAGK